MNRISRTRVISAVMSVALLLGACTDNGATIPDTTVATQGVSVPSETTEPSPQSSAGSGSAGSGSGETPRLFNVNLSQGTSPEIQLASVAVEEGSSLTDEEVRARTEQLPKWEDPTALSVPFAWPTQSTPPPRTGKTVDVAFPPRPNSASEPVVASGPLQVLRVQPEGNVPIAPYLSVTFDQPMVAVGAVKLLTDAEVPVKLDPAIPGVWQWIGTRTLRFDAEIVAEGKTEADVDRLPMATKFTATVPAGTKSATGGSLREAKVFTFSTPPPTIETFAPFDQDSIALQPVFVATFDQLVDPTIVLKTVSLLTGGKTAAVRLATAAEIEADDQAKAMTKSAKPGRWVAFRPVEPMQRERTFTVTVGEGTASAEGSLTTLADRSFSGKTFGPLTVTRVQCGYGNGCPPGSEFTVEFSNPLKAAEPTGITVSPKLAAAQITVDGSVRVTGATQARTEYTITLPATLTDIFGQALGTSESRTITIGAADKWIRPFELITTLDPFAPKPQLSVLSTNNEELRVRVFQADSAAFSEYSRYAQERDNPDSSFPDWKLLSDAKVKPENSKDATVETLIDLSKQLDGKPGQVIVLIEPVPFPAKGTEKYYKNRPTLTWVQSTTIGIDSFVDFASMHVWATDLRSGAPIAGLTVTDGQRSGVTDAKGLTTLVLDSATIEYGFVVARRGGENSSESFILPVNAAAQPQTDTRRWYLTDDRQIYRPGETMRAKGWVRQVPAGTDDLVFVPEKTVGYVVRDAVGTELARGDAPLGSFGGFDLTVEIPKTANTGPAYLELGLGDANNQATEHQHGLQIAEFRRPEFEVKVQPVSEGPFVSTKAVTTELTASYLAGGTLPNAPVNWNVVTNETSFSPAGWGEFTFGIFTPWWLGNDFARGGGVAEIGRSGPWNQSVAKQYSAVTDQNGKHALQLNFEGTDGKLPDLPVSVLVAGTATDVNRQAWSDQRDLLVHSANRYVGLRSDRSFVRQGDELNVEVIATDVDGKSIPGSKLTVTAGLLQSKFVNGKTISTILDPQTCEVTSSDKAVPCSFDTPVGGQYRVESIITDADGGKNRTQLSVWVSGAGTLAARTVEQEVLTVIPDKKEYKPGETAQLLVQAPFASGEGLALVTHNGLRETIRFTVKDGNVIVPVPLTEADMPMTSVTLEVVGASTRLGFDGKPVAGAPKRPAYAVGGLTLSVPPTSRRLTVTANPKDAKLAPGQSTDIAVDVKDATGAPVAGAEFAVYVVDEAVLGLTNYQLADPMGVFYSAGYQFLNGVYGREQIRLVDPQLLVPPGWANPAVEKSEILESAPAETMAAAANESTAIGQFADAAAAPQVARLSKAAAPASGGGNTPVDIRTNFDALAIFQPDVRTDAAGKATVKVTLPDNLTRYRIMVVAANGTNRFGTAESNITAQLPLGVRPSAPRFLNVGDEFELPVVVQNNDTKEATVEVVLQIANLDRLDVEGARPSPNGAALGKKLTIPAGDRREVRFPVSARLAGTAKFRATAFSVNGSDAGSGAGSSDSVEQSLPVFTPGTAEAFATYGVIDDGATSQPIDPPTQVFAGYGGLEVTTSSTSLQSLTDALLYVDTYDYESSDSYSSRILAISSLRKVLADFEAADLPTPAELDAAVERDVKRLLTLQNGDGGFRYWSRADRSEPFTSIQATHALVTAQQAGFAVNEEQLSRALSFAVNVESSFGEFYSERERDSVKAYSLWVRALAGQPDNGAASQLMKSRGDKLSLDALAWIWGSLTDASQRSTVERAIANNAVDTAGAVSFTSSYSDDEYLTLASDRRTDAIVLESLIANAPKSDLIPKVVTGLLADRVQGRWGNVQENTFALLAFKKYYDTYESVEPNFVAKAWLGQKFAGDASFVGRTTTRSRISIPMESLIEGGKQNLVLAKDGKGRMYYRIGLKYVPADLQLEALDRGFVVQRTYEAIDNKADVTRDADGTWKIKAGAKVRVRLTLVAESQRTHVALIDPLPAGLEGLNPALAVTQPIFNTEGGDVAPTIEKRGWWWGNWYDFQQFRDDRSEAFATYLGAGVYDYSYVARATTPGSFVVPPTRAEEMYAPETFGRSATDRVVIG